MINVSRVQHLAELDRFDLIQPKWRRKIREIIDGGVINHLSKFIRGVKRKDKRSDVTLGIFFSNYNAPRTEGGSPRTGRTMIVFPTVEESVDYIIREDFPDIIDLSGSNVGDLYLARRDWYPYRADGLLLKHNLILYPERYEYLRSILPKEVTSPL